MRIAALFLCSGLISAALPAPARDAATAAILPVDLRVANLQPLRVARVLVRTN